MPHPPPTLKSPEKNRDHRHTSTGSGTSSATEAIQVADLFAGVRRRVIGGDGSLGLLAAVAIIYAIRHTAKPQRTNVDPPLGDLYFGEEIAGDGINEDHGD